MSKIIMNEKFLSLSYIRLRNYINGLIQIPLFTNSLYAFLDKGSVALYGLFYTIVFARILTKSEFGIFVLCEVARTFSNAFCDISVGQALIHFGAKRHENSFWEIIWNSLILKILLILIATLIIYSIALISSRYFQSARISSALKLVPILILFTSGFNTALQILNADERISKIFFLDFTQLIILVAILAFAYKFGYIVKAENAIYILIVTRLLSSLSAFFTIKNNLERIFIADWKLVKKIFRYSLFSYFNSLGVLIYTKCDILMLQWMYNSSYVAVYSAAVMFTNMFRMINEPMNMIFFPKISKLEINFDSNFKRKISKNYFKATFISLFISCPFAVVILLFPEEVINIIYGDKYQESAKILYIFAFWGIILPFVRSIATVFNGIGKPEINAIGTNLSGILNIILNVPLILLFNVYGAALASLFTSILLSVVLGYLLEKKYQIYSIFLKK